MATIRNNLNNLKETDVWSFILFALFKMREIPEYTSLSELIYILDKPSLLKLCEYFGGQTITIPTIEEIEMMIYGLLLYELMEVEKLSYEEASSKLPTTVATSTKKIRYCYLKIKHILANYDLSSRG